MYFALNKMNTDFQRAYRENVNSTLNRLGMALEWLGIGHGRVASYKKLLAEYYEGQRSNEHFFAFHQAMDALSTFESWVDSANNFPGLLHKIAVVFKKGPLLPQSESAASNSNRPRNDGFVYILGGKLHHGRDIKIISIDGTQNSQLSSAEIEMDFPSDIVLQFQGNLLGMECKRPMNSSTLPQNVNDALRQLLASRRTNALGIIAVDISKLIERAGQYLEASSIDAGANYLTDGVAEIITPLTAKYRQEWLLGFIGSASIPLVATARSAILQNNGRPYEITNLRTAAVSWVTVKNPKCRNGELLKELHLSFVRTGHGIPSNSVPMN